MASYAPVYRLPTSQRSFLTREQKRESKRKRSASADDDGDGDDDNDDDASASDHELNATVKIEAADEKPRVLHPVNKRDPYYIAGWSREKPLPGGSFPHAGVRELDAGKVSVEEELAKLNPPIYVPKKEPGNPSGSLRGRHLDNLTAILHKCMLNQDWKRASRVWGLILRTEIGGFAPDTRQHGRWMIGAEILMRRGQLLEEYLPTNDSQDTASTQRTRPSRTPVIPDEGFRLAREYYERMCLQYPHLVRSHYSTVNASAIYPALFNIWVYEVQDRSKRARQKLTASHGSPDLDDTQSIHSDTSEHRRISREIRNRELVEATPIVRRLDELLLNPPYDTSAELLELRGMMSLWLANLHTALADNKSAASFEDDDKDNMTIESRSSKGRHPTQAELERTKATEYFLRMVNKGIKLSDEHLAFIEGHNSKLNDTDDH